MDNTSQPAEQALTPETSSPDISHEHPETYEQPTETYTESTESEPSPSTHEPNEPEYLKRRLGRQKRKHEEEKEAMRRDYERQLQERSYQPTYAPEPISFPEGIDLNNPQHLIAVVDELVNQKSVEKENSARQAKMQEKLSQFVEKGKKKYSDLEFLIEDNYGSPAPHGFDKALFNCDNADDVLYQILKTPGEYKKLLSMHDREDVISRVKEISVRLALNSQANKVSKADSPIKPLNSSGLSVNSQKSCKDKRKELCDKFRSRFKR